MVATPSPPAAPLEPVAVSLLDVGLFEVLLGVGLLEVLLAALREAREVVRAASVAAGLRTVLGVTLLDTSAGLVFAGSFEWSLAEPVAALA